MKPFNEYMLSTLTASWWEKLCARWLGELVVVAESPRRVAGQKIPGHRLEVCMWRGRYIIIGYEILND